MIYFNKSPDSTEDTEIGTDTATVSAVSLIGIIGSIITGTQYAKNSNIVFGEQLYSNTNY